MAIWKEQSLPPKESAPMPPPAARKDPEPTPDHQPSFNGPSRTMPQMTKETVIGHELTVEGKIEGAGHVRIAGRFKGDVHVQGNLAIEPGATLTGGVRANSVTIGGHL